VRNAAGRVLREPRLREEVLWTLTTRVVDVVFPFLQMKLLTNLLREEQYGEYSLATTAVALGHSVLIVPVTNAYQRYFHAAPGENTARTAGLQLVRWIAYVTVASVVLGALLSKPAGNLLGWEAWTILAASVLFAADRWRLLSLEMFDFQRQRRLTALFHLGFQILVVGGFMVVVGRLSRTTTAALMVYGLAAAPFALLGIRRLWPVLVPKTGSERGRLGGLIRTFGIPYAILLTFQWVQTNADRYILERFLDKEAVGRYVAVFQVCGVPYLVMFQTLAWLLMPIVYNRVKDATQPLQLWSADRMMIGAIAFFAGTGTLLLGVYWLWGDVLTTWLTRSSYVLPTGTTMLIAVGRFLQCFALLVQMVFAVHERMTASLLFRLVGAGLTVPLCWMLVQRNGIDGAALGAALAGGVYLLILAVGPGGFVWLMRQTRREAAGAARAAASAEVLERD
jgi:O-antigen/teichoic acid export membrane protein